MNNLKFVNPFVNPYQYTVKLTYFRASGKYYAEGQYESPRELISDI